MSSPSPVPSKGRMLTRAALKRAQMSPSSNDEPQRDPNPPRKKVARPKPSVATAAPAGKSTSGTANRSPSPIPADLLSTDAPRALTAATASPSVSGKLTKNNNKRSSSDKAAQTEQAIAEREEVCQQMMFLMSHFSDEQLDRYEVFRRSKFQKNLIRKVVKDATNHLINEQVAIAMAGIAKVFVGEIVETGLDFMEETKEDGPLKPKHIREAVRRIRHAQQKTQAMPFAF